MSDRGKNFGAGKMPGYERLEYYAARHQLDLVKLYSMASLTHKPKLKRLRLGPDCWVYMIPKKYPPPDAAKPDAGRKPCVLEQDFYTYPDASLEALGGRKYDIANLSNELGLATTAECKDWLRKMMGMGANLITEKTNLGPERYGMLLQMGKAQGIATAI